MVELALATSIPVREWEREDDATIATALTILADRAEGD
jgi:hypothetical protein